MSSYILLTPANEGISLSAVRLRLIRKVERVRQVVFLLFKARCWKFPITLLLQSSFEKLGSLFFGAGHSMLFPSSSTRVCLRESVISERLRVFAFVIGLCVWDGICDWLKMLSWHLDCHLWISTRITPAMFMYEIQSLQYWHTVLSMWHLHYCKEFVRYNIVSPQHNTRWISAPGYQRVAAVQHYPQWCRRTHLVWWSIFYYFIWEKGFPSQWSSTHTWSVLGQWVALTHLVVAHKSQLDNNEPHRSDNMILKKCKKYVHFTF